MCGNEMPAPLIAYKVVVEDGQEVPVRARVMHFDNALCLAVYAAGQAGKEVCDGSG